MALLTAWGSSLLRGLLPSFVADAIYPDRKPTWRIHPTSYLDGLRGMASVLVFFCHYTEENHRYMLPSYEKQPNSFLQLPFVRLLYSGRPMVHIFFVLSGFVLSCKPLQGIHARRLDQCYSTLSSSVFRRPIRLFGPVIASSFIIMLLAQSGWLFQPSWLYHQEPSLWLQFYTWASTVFHSITWSWEWERELHPGYDPHLWTIPIELAHSMLLFIVIVALAKVRRFLRQAIVVSLLMYCLRCGKWAAFEFLAGMFLAELYFLQSSGSKAWESTTLGRYRHQRLILSIARTALCVGMVVAAVFIAGWPNFDAHETSGIRFLLSITPEPFFSQMDDNQAAQKFWFALSAVAMVWSCGQLEYFKRFLETRFVQYTGRISYSVYIIHGAVLAAFQQYAVGNVFVPASGEPGTPGYHPEVPGWGINGMVGNDTSTKETLNWLVGLLFVGPFVVWIADVFWRAVDMPSIRLARKVENLCLDDTCHNAEMGYFPAA